MHDAEDDATLVAAVLDTVMQIASGNLDARAPATEREDEIGALVTGVNMLAEEISDKFAANTKLTTNLEQALHEARKQHETILLLSTPTLSMWDGILVVPLIGVLDQERATDMSETLLERVQAAAANVVIIDVTGLATLDTSAAKHLIDTFAAVSLLGAKCILTGISPTNAQNMVGLGVTFTNVATQRTLREGLRLAFELTGLRVVKGMPR